MYGPAVEPERFGSVAEFVAGLELLKDLAGVGDRELARRAALMGYEPPRGGALPPTVLPAESTVVALTRACGCGRDEVARWVSVRRRLSYLPQPAPRVRDVLSWRAIAAWPLAGRAAVVLVAVLVIPVWAYFVQNRVGAVIPAPTRTASSAPAPPGPRVITVSADLTVPDDQQLDLTRGRVGTSGDLALHHGRLIAPAGVLGRLLEGGEPDPAHCAALPAVALQNSIAVFELQPGSRVCVMLAERRIAIVTVDRAPGEHDLSMALHYTLWQQP